MLLYKQGLEEAIAAKHIKKVEPFDFSLNTTYGLGGKAAFAYLPKTVWQAKCAFDLLNSSNKPYQILGLGSNVLVSDNGIDGAVLSTKNLRGIVRLSENKLLCLSGTKVSELLAYCKKHSLGGLEYMYGIPATVGGAAYMNAGVCGHAIGDNIVNVSSYDEKLTVLSRENCNFGYRRSTMRDINALILSIIINVNTSCQEEIDERTEFFKQRRSHLPKGKSCGCVFKNPDGQSAGYLIEAAGLKGFSVGGATVSEKHASFIINSGGTSNDVKAVIEAVKAKVFEKFGVILNEEVVYIGEFNDINS